MLLAQYQAVVYFCLSMIFFFFLFNKESVRVGHSDGRRPTTEKMPLCYVQRPSEVGPADTCCLHTVCHRPEKLPHTYTQRTARKSTENKTIVLVRSLLPASGESGLFPSSASGLPVALMEMQSARKQASKPTASQPSVPHLCGGCGEGPLLLWEAVFFSRVALLVLKAKLIGGEWQGSVVRPWLCAASC